LVLYLLHSPGQYVNDFGNNLLSLKEGVKFCSNCYNLSEEDLCPICQDSKRDKHKIIVVEDVLDLLAFENIGDYHGQYHVLGGLISPMQGIGPEDLNIGGLIKRLKIEQKSKNIVEVIIATNPNLEGEATAMYIREEILNISTEIKVSRIARGLPTGADLDYADKITLLRSLEGRVSI
jgi:recombination protein RecR